MCGLAGIAARNLTAAQVASVGAMTVALSHRGPDSSGVQVLGNCALGNTRLAILDLSERGQQPMPNSDGSSWIITTANATTPRNFGSGSDPGVTSSTRRQIPKLCFTSTMSSVKTA